MPLLRSWVETANDPACPFPLNNLPYGVFSTAGTTPRCGVAIGDFVLDVAAMEKSGLLRVADTPLLDRAAWNPVMSAGIEVWDRLRALLFGHLSATSGTRDQVEAHLHPLANVILHMPFAVTEYTDFYAGQNHAVNVGTMFRGAENALPPNWLHIPIGYNGRASSVVVSGTDVRRPWGQLKGPNDDAPRFAPCARFDLELEMGAIVGTGSNGPVSVSEADEMIFGYVLLNDWSARDIQAWEYQPLGPFQAKATATSLSPWIVTQAALAPFRASCPPRDVELLPHLRDTGPMLYDITLTASIAPEGKPPTKLSQTNYREMYYSAAQQLAHHTTSGCPMNPGDLLGSGTISGPTKPERGSLLELSWGGKDPITLDTGEVRSFLEDGDTLTLSGHAKGDGFTIGFGTCSGKILPALPDPYAR